jgi:hypothetical protein
LAVLAPFPNFLIIGVERNATRWLRFNLHEHPEICAPPLRLDFFSDFERMVQHGLRWYREQFHEWDGEPFLGEASPSYLMWFNQPDQVASRIQKLMPDVRLLAIVGDPIDRLMSALRHHIRWGRIPPDTSIENFIDLDLAVINDLNLFSGFIQAACLEPYVERFGDQVHVLVKDDIVSDPHAVYADALRHIGASDDFAPAHLERVLYSDRPAVEIPDIELSQRQQLYSWCARDVAALEELIGRDLSAWNPGRPDVDPSEAG